MDQLSSVTGLSCDGGICSWASPYSPIGTYILQYYVTVIQNGSIVQEGSTGNTSWRFCPHNIGGFGTAFELIVVPINSLNIVGKSAVTTGILDITGKYGHIALANE